MATIKTQQPPDLWLPEVCRVADVRRHRAEDVITLTLKHTVAGRVFRAGPGQFYMLYVPGIGEVPISISGLSSNGQQISHTIRAVGPVSEALCRLRPGDPCGSRGPYGTGWPDDHHPDKPAVFIAGGLGMAPLKPALEDYLRGRGDGRRIYLLYGSRDPAGLLYEKETAAWQEAGVTVLRTVDVSAPGWDGPIGVVTNLIGRIREVLGEARILLCGPEIMMRFCLSSLQDTAADPSQIYLSMERNMKCAIGVCGHCQWGADFICKEGPVFPSDRIAGKLHTKEL